MKTNTLPQTHARLKFKIHRASPQTSRQQKLSKKSWLSLRRAVEPTTTTRSPAPFSRGAVRKSAAFIVSFRSLSHSLRDGSWNIPMHRGQRKVSKRLDTITRRNNQPHPQSGIIQNHNHIITTHTISKLLKHQQFPHLQHRYP